jgi:hypothetical protein
MLHVRVAAALFSRRMRHLVLLTNVWWDNGVAVAWFSAGRELKRCLTQFPRTLVAGCFADAETAESFSAEFIVGSKSQDREASKATRSPGSSRSKVTEAHRKAAASFALQLSFCIKQVWMMPPG